MLQTKALSKKELANIHKDYRALTKSFELAQKQYAAGLRNLTIKHFGKYAVSKGQYQQAQQSIFDQRRESYIVYVEEAADDPTNVYAEILDLEIFEAENPEEFAEDDHEQF